MQLVRSKIERPVPGAHLARARVTALLEASVGSGLATFVVGRAGTGKSVASLDFTDANARRVAWYTVDASDSEFERFVAYLSEALGLRSRADAGRLSSDLVAERLLGELYERAEAP